MLLLTRQSELRLFLALVGLMHAEVNRGNAIEKNLGLCSYVSTTSATPCTATEAPPHIKPYVNVGCSGSVYVPYGNETVWQTGYISRGPSVHDLTVAALTDRLQIGKSLLLKVSGVPILSKEDVSMVSFTVSGNSGPQCLCNISVKAREYFTCYINAVLPSAGLYHLNVTVRSGSYTHSASWKIIACPSGTTHLSLMLSKREQDTPSRAPRPTEASTKFIHSHKRAVWIHSDKQVYATQTDVTFVAETQGLDSLYFRWRFGDGPEIKTTSGTFTKRYRLPDKYNVTVSVSDGLTSVRSDVYPVVIQRAVQPNRLLHRPSVLLNSAVNFTCRISSGTDVSYRWMFGDGTERYGSSTEHHVFNRTGEYIVKVVMSNLVSSAYLTGHIFVVKEPCQPPMVKNMGPNKIQVWRYQNVRLAVTFEAPIQCSDSSRLLYRWTLYDMSGQPLFIPNTKTDRQYFKLPKYFLHYGTYKATAKVQVAGNIVYSNYSVLIEVLLSNPVSIINEATNIFISRGRSSIVTLDGRKSHDPDYPNNTISYRWSCRPVNTKESRCFNTNITMTSPALQFPTKALRSGFDLIQFTLSVRSRNRSSSSEVFITVTSKPVSHVHVSRKHGQENLINWNEEFSVSAVCNECGVHPQNTSFSWKLYLVNASSKVATEAVFFSSVDFGLPFKIEENIQQQPSVTPYTAEPSVSPAVYLTSNDTNPTAPFTQDVLALVQYTHTHAHDMNTQTFTKNPNTSLPATEPSLPSFLLSALEETESSGSLWEYQGSLSPSDSVSLTDVTSEYDYYSFGAEEADTGVPVGRPTGSDSIGFNWNRGSSSHKNEGDNLVDPSLLGRVTSEKTVLDLHRHLFHQTVFESYTLTGLSSSVVTFKPFMLKPKSLYLLEVSATSVEGLQGKSQLFLHTQAVPEGLICQVQPSSGSELHTHFSIFCSSGKEDLVYEFSYSVGNSPRKLLYEGRDYQHYFNLPSGDPNDKYKVTVYVQIKNRFGGATKRSAVAVTVLPSFQWNPSSQLSPDQKLYLYGIGNLTDLVNIGSDRDIINYIHLLTTVLNRLSVKQESSTDVLRPTRSKLISAVCQQTIADQEILLEIIYTLTDLIKISGQVMSDSAQQVIQHVQNISYLLHESKPQTGLTLDSGLLNALVSLLSLVLDAPVENQFINKALYTITDLVLRYMLSSNVLQYNVSSTSMNALAWKVDRPQTLVKTFGLATFHLTDLLKMQFQQWSSNRQDKPCVITWITQYKQNPQLSGDVADIRLFNCSTRKEIKVRHLSIPVTVEFQRRKDKNSRHETFIVLRDQMNTHRFNVTPKMLHKAFQITVCFSRPAKRPFPILLLLRMYEQPTPNLYNKQKVLHWRERTAQMFLPASSLHVSGTVYLTLLNAEYNQSPGNKYTAGALNYTLSIESVECLSRDGVTEWKPKGCSTHAGVSPDKINCRCNHLTSFTVSRQDIFSSHNSTDVSQLLPLKTNYTLIIVSVIFLALYMVLLILGGKADVSVQKTTGPFLLPEDNTSDQFLYAVTIDTGFRSRTKMTAQVHIVLYGDAGVSQTRELSGTDSKLFTCNSRSTFILRTSESLGRVCKVHLWHNNGGSSPSWYVSHVVVRDVLQGSCWFFLGQCWLAVDEGDGKVERVLIASEGSLTFKQFLYLKLTQYLVDFHPWWSSYSCPSHSSHTRAQRLSVCALLLQGYMCVNTILINVTEDQHIFEMGLIDVSLVSMVTGLCSALAVMPVGCLVSLVFRVSKTNISKSLSEEQYKVKLPDLYVKDHRETVLMGYCPIESNLSCSNLSSYWTHSGTQRKQHKEDPDAIIEIADDSVSDINNRSHVRNKWNQSDLRSCTSPDVQETKQVCVGTISGISGPGSWCYYLAWILCISLSVMCIFITVTLGTQFSRTNSFLWIHSVFFSLVCCGFVLHPVMILIMAITVSLLHRKRPDWVHSLSFRGSVTELMRRRGQKINALTQGRMTPFEKVVAARQRARYLRLVRPPNSRDLKCVRGLIKRKTLLHKTTRELMLHLIMMSLILFVTYGKSDNDYKYHLNQAVKSHFTKNSQNSFYSIQKRNDWWNWTATTFLDRLYHNASYQDKEEKTKAKHAYSVIASPVIRKIESRYNSSYQVLNFLKSTIQSETVDEGLSSANSVSNDQSVVQKHSLCGKLGCYEGMGTSVNLGRTRSKVMKCLKKLQTEGWMNPFTHVVTIQFVLYNAPSNLFTSVTVLLEQNPTGALIPSVTVKSTRLYHFPVALDYSVMICELLFLVFILLHMYWQIYVMAQKGWFYWRNLWSWLEVTVIICSLLRFACSVYLNMLKTEIIDFLQREDFKLYADLSPIFNCEKLSQSILGIVVNLLLLRCVLFLRLNRTGAAVHLICSNLLWLLAPGVIVGVAVSCVWNLISRSFPSTNISGFVALLFSCSSVMDHLSAMFYQTKAALYYGGLFCTVIPMKAMVIGTFMIFVKQTKTTKKRKHLITVHELISHITNKTLLLIGKGRHKPTDPQVHTNSLCLAEFEDLMDELLFYLCTMSNHTLPAKDVFETQSDFSLSHHDHNSDSENSTLDATCSRKQTYMFEKIQNLDETRMKPGCLDLRGISLSCEENYLRSPLEREVPPHLGQDRGRTREGLSKWTKGFRNHLKEPVSSKQLNCDPAEWKSFKHSERLCDPASMRDDHSNAYNSEALAQMKGHSVSMTTSCQRMSCVFNVLPTEGMDNYSVEEKTIIPGYVEH